MVETTRIDEWIAGSTKSPNMGLLEAALERAGEARPVEGDIKTKLESVLSTVLSALIQEARSEGNRNFESIVPLIKDQVGLDVKV